MARLGVNIDHVATLRQARGECYPSLVDAAKIALDAGADQITIHLREDRRHIQDRDVPAIKKITQTYGVPLNLELGAAKEIIAIAKDIEPDWLCLVPEKREERTTEGGLDLLNVANQEKLQKVCADFKKTIPASKISLFVEANTEILNFCMAMPVDAVEIHTGDFAKAHLLGQNCEKYLAKFADGKKQIGEKLGYHAGHGLTDLSVVPLVQQQLFEEYNIGHWIISDAIFRGLFNTVSKLKNIIQG